MDDILSVERPFDRRTPCIGLGVGGGGPRGLWMFPGPDILQLLPPFDLSKPAEVDLRDGGSPAGKTSFAPGAAMWNVERSLTWTGVPDLYFRIKNTVFTPRQDKVLPQNLALKYVRSSSIRKQRAKMDRAKTRSLWTGPCRTKPGPASSICHVRSVLLWDITQHRVVTTDRRCKTPYTPHLQRPRNPKQKTEHEWSLKVDSFLTCPSWNFLKKHDPPPLFLGLYHLFFKEAQHFKNRLCFCFQAEKHPNWSTLRLRYSQPVRTTHTLTCSDMHLRTNLVQG